MNFCINCRWLSDDAKGRKPSEWTCARTVNTVVDLVSGQLYPHLLCHAVRRKTGEDCPEHEAGANCLAPKTLETA